MKTSASNANFIIEDLMPGLFSSRMIQRGRNYYYQGRVIDLKYGYVTSTFLAVVKGSIPYDVEITFHEDGIDYGCSCPAYAEYHECKHIVATLFEIHGVISDYPNQETFTFLQFFQEDDEEEDPSIQSQMLIKFLSQITEKESQQPIALKTQPLKVDYQLRLAPEDWGRSEIFKLSLKVGVERAYVVKKISEFLEHIQKQKPMTFTQKFTFNPHEHVFQEEDQRVIDLLMEISANESFFSYSAYNEQHSKEITIPPAYLENLWELIKDLDVSQCQILGQNYQDLIFTDSSPLSFKLLKSDDNYILNLEALNEMTYIEKYRMLVSGNRLYKIDENQAEILHTLDDTFEFQSNRDHIFIKKDDLQSFVSIVTPQLKKIAEIEMDNTVAKEIIQVPLNIHLYLDQEDDILSAKAEFQYEDNRFSPFESEGQVSGQGHTAVIRDFQKENQFLYLLEQTDFRVKGNMLYMNNEDDETIFNFLFEQLPQFQTLTNIHMTNAIKKYFDDHQSPSIHIEHDADNHLLEVNFDFHDINEHDVQKIIQSVNEKKKYYRLPSGAFISLETEEYHQMEKLFEEFQLKSTNYENGQVKLPAYRSLQLDEMLGQRNAAYSKTFHRLISDIKQPEDRDVSIPGSLQAKLRDYQFVGYQWFKSLSHYGFGGILADDMGLGKTLQSIAFLLSEWEEHKEQGEKSEPALVVAPASLIYNWQHEFAKFAPKLRVMIITGTKQEREALLNDLSGTDVAVTSYPSLRQDEKLYKNITFSALILDEAQAIKNHATKITKAVKSLKAGKRFALSGTPIENSLDELWSLYDAIMPGFFPNKTRFKKMTQEKIAQMSRPFILRRLKKDVLKELPDKIETVHSSELTTQQKELYLGYLERIRGETLTAIASEGIQKSRLKILAGLTRLRQLCCHPSLFIENYQGESGKLNQLIELVENALENGQRLLIFSQFSSMLQIIQKELVARGLSTFYLDGQTPAKDRVDMAEQFNNNHGEKEIFLISLKAGGTGLNLTGADTVILYDLWWNPAIEEQAAGRAHRIGQKKVVQVQRLITTGTIEEKIYELQRRKKALIDNIIQPGETLLSSLSEEDIRGLLS